MKKSLKGDDMPYLPQEIIIEVLKRLPVKSLIRFQCVHKQWQNLIKSPSFITHHLHHSTHQNQPSLLFSEHDRTCEPLHLSLMDCDLHVRKLENPPLIGSSSGVRIIGSSNGLLCVVINEFRYTSSRRLLRSSLLLWNPATRKIREIPRTRTSKHPEWNHNGFGFSSAVNDYKIVQTYNARNEEFKAVEVYSLNTDSWKEIDFGSLKGVNFIGDSVTTNGCIFWNGTLYGLCVIVSFDIATELFTLIPMPPPPNNNKRIELSVYEDKVAILTLSFPNFLIDLWVLEEGVVSSTKRWGWTKKFTRNHIHCPSALELESPGIIWRNEIVVGSLGRPGLVNRVRFKHCGKREFDYESNCYLINVVTSEGKMVAISGCRDGDVFNHVESLVSIGDI